MNPEPSLNIVPFNDLQLLHEPLREAFHRILDDALDHSSFIGGAPVRGFEQAFARFCSTPDSVGVANGTEALVIALKVLGIGIGDLVVTVPNTFIATAEAISLCGATPLFVDVSPKDLNMCPEALERTLTEHPYKNKIRGVIPVHLHGRPADMQAITRITQSHGLFCLADGAQAHGAFCDGRPIAHWGEATTFSFYPGKNLGALGDAGAVASQNETLLGQMRAFANHGRKDKYFHSTVGCNARIDALQADFLSLKLELLEKHTSQRQAMAKLYTQKLQNLPQLLLPEDRPESPCVYHLFVLLTHHRDALQQHLHAQGIHTGVHYPCPLHLQQAYESLGHRKGDFPHAEEQAETTLSLPLYPGISTAQIERVTNAIHSFFNAQPST